MALGNAPPPPARLSEPRAALQRIEDAAKEIERQAEIIADAIEELRDDGK